MRNRTRRRSSTAVAIGLAAGALASGPTPAAAQQTLTSDVAVDSEAAVFVYTDVENFTRALSAIDGGEDPAEALMREYFDAATPGLRMFIEKYDLTRERLLSAMERRPDEYRQIGATLEALKAREPWFRRAYAAIARIIPDAVFPPTYFVVAGYRGIGSGSVEGPLISIEKKTVEAIAGGGVEPTLVHEMMHMQQLAAVGEDYFAIFSGEERTLLALSIREGAATYFSELITGGSEHKNEARDYYLSRETELWDAFQADMLGHDMGDWLWEQPENPEQPRDLGYAIGARVVEAYYQSASDKAAAARRVMAITDYPAFLSESAYTPGR